MAWLSLLLTAVKCTVWMAGSTAGPAHSLQWAPSPAAAPPWPAGASPAPAQGRQQRVCVRQLCVMPSICSWGGATALHAAQGGAGIGGSAQADGLADGWARRGRVREEMRCCPHGHTPALTNCNSYTHCCSCQCQCASALHGACIVYMIAARACSNRKPRKSLLPWRAQSCTLCRLPSCAG